jgi:hypothetical protein
MQKGFGGVYYNIREFITTSSNISLFNSKAEFAKLLIRLYFKYRVFIKTLNYLEDVYIEVLVKNI